VRQEIENAVKSLFEWMRSEGFRGHDPHDLLESPFIKPIESKLPAVGRIALLQLGRRSPLDLHSFFRVPKTYNPKGLALIISGLVQAKDEITTDWREISEKLATHLISGPKKAWGYPFAWQSRTHYLPQYYPTIVSTAFVGEALCDLYLATNSSAYLDAAKEACEYILTDVSRTENENGIAFGYAKNDPQIVFNASILGAALLARVGSITNNEQHLLTAYSAARFVVHYQQEDGSWKYGLEANQTWIDSFHTAFVLLSLQEIAKHTHQEQFAPAIESGYTYFRKYFFESDYTPRYYHNRTYPIDAHVAGTAIQTLARFDDLKLARQVALKTIELLQAPEGYFYYQRHPKWVNKITYMRWSNAWMFRGLTELLSRG